MDLPDSSPERAVRLDVDRTQRLAMPEAIYCQAKTTEQCVDIVGQLLASAEAADTIIATRANTEQQAALLALRPEAHYGPTLTWRHRQPSGFTFAVVSAGTSDHFTAQEAALTLAALGHGVIARNDVGVAGLQRLTAVVPDLAAADAIIAIAGMEGALPTVLAGLVPQPIVAVPTSAGYGTSFEGVTALLSMMASCAPGIAVVGIDNGYGAASAIHRLAYRRENTQ